MATVAAAYPDDSEASIFYALAIAAAASPTDKTFADQLKAGAILEKLYRRASRIIPGLAHYIIHSYDVPPLADRALDAAAPLREDRAVGAARAAHAVAHVHAARLLAGVDRHQHSRRARSRGATARSPKNCTRWTTGSTPTCRPRRTRRRGSCSTRCRRCGAVRSRRDRIGRARFGRRLRARGDPGALRARARRVGRGRQARAAAEQVSVHRSAHLLRASDRRRAHRRRRRRRGRRSTRCRTIQRAADRGQGDVLGRADADSTARRIGVAGVRRRDARPTRWPRCAPPPRSRTAPRSPR